MSLHTRMKPFKSGGKTQNICVLDSRFVQEMKCIEYTPPSLSLCDVADMEHWKAQLTYIYEDLQDLLTLPYEQFWCEVIHEASILQCIDSYLKKAKRRFDQNAVDISPEIQPLVDDVHRLVFMVLLRTSTYKESDENFIDQDTFGEVLYEHFIYDIPKLMDLCIVYGEDNHDLVTKMIENIIHSQPKYKDDLRNTLETVDELFSRLCDEIDVGVTSPSGRPHRLSSQERRRTIREMPVDRFQDTVFYLLDTALTLRAFLSVAGRVVTHVFIEQDFKQSVASLYENLIPFLQERLIELDLPKCDKIKLSVQLAQISAALVRIVRDLIENHCLNPLIECSDSREKQSLIEIYIEIITALFPCKQFMAAMELNFPLEDDYHIILQKDNNKQIDTTRLDYLLQSLRVIIEEVEIDHPEHPLSRQKREKGVLVDADWNMAAALDIATNGEDPVTKAKPSHLEGACAARPLTPPLAELESLVFAVQDVIPDLGIGFVQTCLEEYDFNSEAVINAVLEGSLPPYLKQMDHSLPQRQSRKGNEESNDRWLDLPAQVEGLSIHLGKREDTLAPMSQEEKRRLVETYDEQEEDEDAYDPEGAAILAAGLGNHLEYEDEYDDTYESTIAAVEPDAYSNKRDNADPRNSKNPDHFIENPEVIRERLAAKRAARGGRGGSVRVAPPPRDLKGERPGHGQSEKVVKDRTYKDRNKGQRANHNRRDLASRKMQKGMF